MPDAPPSALVPNEDHRAEAACDEVLAQAARRRKKPVPRLGRAPVRIYPRGGKHSSPALKHAGRRIIASGCWDIGLQGLTNRKTTGSAINAPDSAGTTMSVYKPKGSPVYHYDFWCRNRRFHGSTKRTDRREAQAVEKAEREDAKHSSASTRRTTPAARGLIPWQSG